MTYNQDNWNLLELEISKRFKVTADFDFMLFLIGIQERGTGIRPYERQEKMDLINLGKCTLLTEEGYLKRKDNDEDGWPGFEEIKNLKSLTPTFLNATLKRAAYNYLTEKLH